MFKRIKMSGETFKEHIFDKVLFIGLNIYVYKNIHYI